MKKSDDVIITPNQVIRVQTNLNPTLLNRISHIGSITNSKMRERLKRNQKRQEDLVLEDLLEDLSNPTNRRGRHKKKNSVMNNRSAPHDH